MWNEIKRATKLLSPAYPDASLNDTAWTMPGQAVPISVTKQEGDILAATIQARGLKSGYELATGCGVSSFFIGFAFKQTGGKLISLDSYIEERVQSSLAAQTDVPSVEPTGLYFAAEWRNKFALPVTYAIGRSPTHVPPLLAGEKIDFIFIDGCHLAPWPSVDANAVLPHLAEHGVCFFHDSYEEVVQRAVVHFASWVTGTVTMFTTRHGLAMVEW